MSLNDPDKREVLRIVAEENYAHARDHEHLRGQVTSMLVAAAFVLVGLVLGNQVRGPAAVYASVLTVLLGILNVIVVVIHNNRFDWHVSIAQAARRQLFDLEIQSEEVTKRGSLSAAWLVVASVPIAAGIGLFFVQSDVSFGRLLH